MGAAVHQIRDGLLHKAKTDTEVDTTITGSHDNISANLIISFLTLSRLKDRYELPCLLEFKTPSTVRRTLDFVIDFQEKWRLYAIKC
jgi:hypothetical protein